MPHTAQTHPGKSFRERAGTAARLTAEQSKARKGSRANAPGKARKAKPEPKTREASKASGAAGGARALLATGGRRVVLIVVALVLLLIVALYPVGQTYYQSMRREQRLDAQVTAVEQRNSALQQKNKDLKTDEGIEDAAREQGYVNKGDKAAVITGSGQSTAESSEIPDKVDTDSIEAPHTWYYDILDVLFFVQYD